MEQFKKYKRKFSESAIRKTRKESLPEEKLPIVEKYARQVKRIFREMEDDGVSTEVIKSAISSVENIIVDAIKSNGVASPVVETLTDAAQELELQANLQSDIEGMSEGIQNLQNELEEQELQPANLGAPIDVEGGTPATDETATDTMGIGTDNEVDLDANDPLKEEKEDKKDDDDDDDKGDDKKDDDEK